MIVCDAKQKMELPLWIRDQLESYRILLFLTGSRFFGNYSRNSDFDFYCEYRVNDDLKLERAGWKIVGGMLSPYGYNGSETVDPNLRHVRRKLFAPSLAGEPPIQIDIQMVPNLLWKHRVNEWLRTNTTIGNIYDKETKKRFWIEAYSQLPKLKLLTDQTQTPEWAKKTLYATQALSIQTDKNGKWAYTSAAPVSTGMPMNGSGYIDGLAQDRLSWIHALDPKNGEIKNKYPFPPIQYPFPPIQVSIPKNKTPNTCTGCNGASGKTPYKYTSRIGRPDRFMCKDCISKDIEKTLNTLEPESQELIRRLTGGTKSV